MDEHGDIDQDGEPQDVARRRVLRRGAEVLHAIGSRTPIVFRHGPPYREPSSRPEAMLRAARACAALADERDARLLSEGILALAQSSRSLIADELSLKGGDTSPHEAAALQALQALFIAREVTGD